VIVLGLYASGHFGIFPQSATDYLGLQRQDLTLK
jgi:hypothetical protein